MSQFGFPFSTTVANASLPVCGCLSSASTSTSGFHCCCYCHYNYQNLTLVYCFVCFGVPTVSHLCIYLFITVFLISFSSLSQHTLRLYSVLLQLTFTNVSAIFLFLYLGFDFV